MKKKNKLSAISILLLFASLGLSVSCATVKVPNTRIHAEIPFQDGPEAVFVETIGNKNGFIPNKEWEELRPYMLMIHVDDWAENRQAWYEACRWAGEKCNLVVDSIDGAVKRLDQVIKLYFGRSK